MKKRSLLLCLACITVAGAVLRIAGSMDALWLDETWSMLLLKHADTIGDIFTKIHLDNNHYLNSAYMFLLGPDRAPFLYRIPALVSGILLSILVPLRSLRKNRPQEAVFVALFVCFSFLLIDQSGQARGYMPMLLCGYLATECLEYFCKTKKILFAGLFGITALLAFCWHITFLEWYGLLFLYSLFLLTRQKNSTTAMIQQMLLLHILPLIGISLIIWFDLRFLQIGFLMISPLWVKALQIFVSVFGLPYESRTVLSLAALILLPCTLWMINVCFRGGDTRKQGWISVSILAIIPVLLIQTGAAPRHFFPLTFLFLLALAHVVSILWQGKQKEKIAATCIVAAFLSGNLLQTSRLFRYGRGEALPALTYIAAQDDSDPVTVFTGSMPLVRNLTDFYWPKAGTTAALNIIHAGKITGQPPRWYLAADDPYRLIHKAPEFTFAGAHFKRVKADFQSRSYWTVYERQSPDKQMQEE